MDVKRSGADKEKRGHDIDDKGRDKRSDDGVASGDRDKEQEESFSKKRRGLYKTRVRRKGRDKEDAIDSGGEEDITDMTSA